MGGDTRLDDRGGTAAVVAPVWRDAILRRWINHSLSNTGLSNANFVARGLYTSNAIVTRYRAYTRALSATGDRPWDCGQFPELWQLMTKHTRDINHPAQWFSWEAVRLRAIMRSSLLLLPDDCAGTASSAGNWRQRVLRISTIEEIVSQTYRYVSRLILHLFISRRIPFSLQAT